MKTVCICGSHPDTRELAPFDKDVELWVFNEAPTAPWCKRWDVCFQLHDEVIYTNPLNRCDKNHWQFLQQEHPGKIIYMREHDPRVPACKVFPLEQVRVFLKPQKMFTSTISMAIALAIHQGYEKIILIGVEMSSQTEYYAQRDGVAYWIGYAQGAGVQIELRSGKDIFDRPIYGYEGQIFQEPKDYIARIDALRAARYKCVDEEQEARRAMKRAWENPEEMPDALMKTQNAAIHRGMIEGAEGEIQRYYEKVQEMIKLTGKAVIDRNEFESAQAAHIKQIPQKEGEMNVARGVLQYALGLWQQMKFSEEAAANAKQFMSRYIDACYNAGLASGRRDENARLKNELDKLIGAAGGIRTLEAAKELIAQ